MPQPMFYMESSNACFLIIHMHQNQLLPLCQHCSSGPLKTELNAVFLWTAEAIQNSLAAFDTFPSVHTNMFTWDFSVMSCHVCLITVQVNKKQTKQNKQHQNTLLTYLLWWYTQTSWKANYRRKKERKKGKKKRWGTRNKSSNFRNATVLSSSSDIHKNKNIFNALNPSAISTRKMIA